MFWYLKDRTITPPGGWRFKQEGASREMGENTKEQLIDTVQKYRTANGIVWVGDVGDEIENQIALGMDPGNRHRYCRESTTPRAKEGVGWNDALRFLGVVASWIRGGCGWVDQSEAERRALICASCPHNVRITGCGTCRQTLEAAVKTLGGRTTSQDSKLLACGVCGCENRTAVHVPLNVMMQHYKGLNWPEWCWKAGYETPTE